MSITASAAKLKINKKSLTLRIGQNATLNVLNNKKRIKWISKNKRILECGS
jgi:hypothetical protein